jgi:hypothetical protein
MKIPVDRALNIYSAIANRNEPRDIRDRLSRHLMQKVIEGERDQHRLTVHGLSFLQRVDRERDSRS